MGAARPGEPYGPDPPAACCASFRGLHVQGTLEPWGSRHVVLKVGQLLIKLERVLRFFVGNAAADAVCSSVQQLQLWLAKQGGCEWDARPMPTSEELILERLELFMSRVKAAAGLGQQEQAAMGVGRGTGQGGGVERSVSGLWERGGGGLLGGGQGGQQERQWGKERGVGGGVGNGAGGGAGGQGWGRQLLHSLGADKVDPDNLVLTILLGALAGVLWLRQRQMQEMQQGQVRRSPEGGRGVQQQRQEQQQRELQSQRGPVTEPQQQQQQQQEGEAGQRREQGQQQQPENAPGGGVGEGQQQEDGQVEPNNGNSRGEGSSGEHLRGAIAGQQPKERLSS